MSTTQMLSTATAFIGCLLAGGAFGFGLGDTISRRVPARTTRRYWIVGGAGITLVILAAAVPTALTMTGVLA